jgi:hypothetical protein
MFNMNIELNVHCEGDYVPRIPSVTSVWHGTFTEGAPSSVKNFKVYLGGTEITKLLSVKEISELKNEWLYQYDDQNEEAV